MSQTAGVGFPGQDSVGRPREAAPWAPVRALLSLRSDTDHEGTSSQVRADAEFRGGSAWALIFAILIASVGLNVNSTAVIIGAMLISPLMGPIVGAGFALATNDFRLLRQSLRTLLVATAVAVVASTLYFTLSPLEDAQSELLARTRPTLYDVLIALFGGGAGAVAVTRKGAKGNAVPGVAIATALMPPLCTAGYGLAQRSPAYFLGALHLFLINALFIALATLAFVRLMRFEPLPSSDPAREVSALYPGLVSVGVGHESGVDDSSEATSLRPVVVASWRKMPSSHDLDRLRSFCARRLGVESLRLVYAIER